MTIKKSGSQYLVNGESHYERNKGLYKNYVKTRKKKIKEFIRSLKDKPCTDCKIKYPYYVMDFDHRNPKEKFINPSQIFNIGWGDKKIKEELDKCDLVCANCHRQRTFLRNKELIGDNHEAVKNVSEETV